MLMIPIIKRYKSNNQMFMKYANVLDRKVSFFKSVTDTLPITENLNELLASTEYVGAIEKVRACTNDEKKYRLKAKLPAFTVSGIFDGNTDSSIIEHSGLIAIDFDQKDNVDVKGFDKLKELISTVPYVAYCAHSISGKGYYCIIPIGYTKLHRAHFTSLVRAFSRCGLTVDKSGINEGRKRFVTFDNEPYINVNAIPYTHYVEAECKRVASQRTANEDDLKMVTNLSELAEERGIDITGNYEQWFSIACALASDFEEEGREVFNRFSSPAESYDPDKCDAKFDDALSAVTIEGKLHPSIATVLMYCKDAGLTAVLDFDALR